MRAAIDAALAPLVQQFKRRADAYDYERELLYQRVWGYGPPEGGEPKDYERTELADLADRSAEAWENVEVGQARSRG